MNRLIVIGEDLGAENLERIRQAAPDFEVITCADRKRFGEVAEGAEIIFSYWVPQDLYARAQKLRWINSISAGVNQWMVPEVVNSEIILTNSSGAHGPQISELILAQMFAFATGLHILIRAQMTKDTDARQVADKSKFELEGQTLGVVGLGAIGDALAQKAAGMGMRVIALKRTATAKPHYVDILYTTEGLAELLQQADHVALCLPLTEHTKHIIGERELRSMKRTAYIYNIGRGASIDQDALIRALQEGRIAGAGLDVTTPEPLPPDNPLWDISNVMLSQHTSGGSPFHTQRITTMFIENLQRYIDGEPLLRLVDKQLEY